MTLDHFNNLSEDEKAAYLLSCEGLETTIKDNEAQISSLTKENETYRIGFEFILKQISLAKEQNPDLIFVNMHWGYEYHTKQSTEQERLANLLFTNGVDVILGSHPHVLQGFEYYNGVPIVYSMGNFIFNNSTKDSMMIEATLNENLTCSLRVIPCGMSGVKMTAKSEEASEKVYEYLASISYNVQIDENGYLVSVDYPSE